jgi:hypothetical protein
MNLRIKSIEDLDTDKERIELEATDNDNATNYIIIYASNHENIEIANKCRDAFWFPNQAFKKGDIVRVFIKAGKSSSIVMPNNSKRYTFYWDLPPRTASENRGHLKLVRIIELSSNR